MQLYSCIVLSANDDELIFARILRLRKKANIREDSDIAYSENWDYFGCLLSERRTPIVAMWVAKLGRIRLGYAVVTGGRCLVD